MLLKVLIILLFCHFSKQEDLYHFSPASRTLELYDGDRVEMGFEELPDNKTKFTQCYIQSDVLTFSYELYSNETIDPPDFSMAILSCAFHSYSSNLSYTGNWAISVYDQKSNKNYTEVVKVAIYYGIEQYGYAYDVFPSASILNLIQNNSIVIQTCKLQFSNTIIELNLNQIEVNNEDHPLKSRLASIGSGRCGFKIFNIKKTDPTIFNIYVIDENQVPYKNFSFLRIQDGRYYVSSFCYNSGTLLDSGFGNITMSVYIGDSITIKCGGRIDKQRFCYLYNPKNELVQRSDYCSYQLDIVTIEDLGIWKCTIGHQYAMNSIQATTELLELKSEYVTVFTDDTNGDYYILGCQLHNYIFDPIDYGYLDYCRFTRPDGLLFQISEFSFTEFYNSLTLDLRGGKCSIEIQKPLREEEKGTWRCEAITNTNKVSGGFINVEKTTVLPYNNNVRKNIRLGSSFMVECSVPYGADLCHIVAPNGTHYIPEDPLAITTGFCSLNIENAVESDNGVWKCSISQSNGIPNEIISIEISIIEFDVLFANAESAENEQVELICNTNGISLQYCLFSSPQGQVYYLTKSNDIIGKRISYMGRGLEYGDCGISIAKVQMSDGGKWQCHISSLRSNNPKKQDVIKTIELNIYSHNIQTAESLGIGFGVLGAILTIAGFVFYKFWKKRTNSQEEVTFTGRDSEESVVLSVIQSTYNT